MLFLIPQATGGGQGMGDAPLPIITTITTAQTLSGKYERVVVGQVGEKPFAVTIAPNALLSSLLVRSASVSLTGASVDCFQTDAVAIESRRGDLLLDDKTTIRGHNGIVHSAGTLYLRGAVTVVADGAERGVTGEALSQNTASGIVLDHATLFLTGASTITATAQTANYAGSSAAANGLGLGDGSTGEIRGVHSITATARNPVVSPQGGSTRAVGIGVNNCHRTGLSLFGDKNSVSAVASGVMPNAYAVKINASQTTIEGGAYSAQAINISDTDARDGAANALWVDAGTVTVTGGRFLATAKNNASAFGGYFHSATLLISGDPVFSATATNGQTATCLFIAQGTATIRGGTFVASKQGEGAVFVNTDVTIAGGTFSDVSARIAPCRVAVTGGEIQKLSVMDAEVTVSGGQRTLSAIYLLGANDLTLAGTGWSESEPTRESYTDNKRNRFRGTYRTITGTLRDGSPFRARVFDAESVTVDGVRADLPGAVTFVP